MVKMLKVLKVFYNPENYLYVLINNSHHPKTVRSINNNFRLFHCLLILVPDNFNREYTNVP